MRVAFVWNEIEHWTFPDLCETLILIESQNDADSFLLAYSDVCDDAEHNIGYMADVISASDTFKDDAERILKLFDVKPQIEPRQIFNTSSLGVKKSVDKPAEE